MGNSLPRLSLVSNIPFLFYVCTCVVNQLNIVYSCKCLLLFSGGPKNYAYKTSTGKTCCKVRGFTLNFRNSQMLNFESLKSLVCTLHEEEEKKKIPLRNPTKICRDVKKRTVFNKEEVKLYSMVYDKRVVQPDFTTLPYGF